MSMHTCHENGCEARATDRCFECGAWRCVTHLVRISLPTFEGFFAESVCSACLQAHVTHPDPYGQIIIETASAASPSALAR